MKLVQRRQQRHEPNNLASGAIKHARERTGLLFADLRRAALGSGRLDDQLGQNPEKAIDEQCNEEDGYEVQYIEREFGPFGPVNGETGHRFFGTESITLEEQGCASDESSILSRRTTE